MIVGGGRVGTDILTRFFDLAGGRDAPLVVIPTANGADVYPDRLVGPADVQGLRRHEHHPAAHERPQGGRLRGVREADHDGEASSGSWAAANGGSSDSYLHTRTQREVERVLERGGVVGGSSAGASILASYMVRGARENNYIMMAPGYEEGFGLIKGVAIDQHMLTRNRQDDLEEVVAKHPEVLGIGIDESTAIIVQRPAVRDHRRQQGRDPRWPRRGQRARSSATARSISSWRRASATTSRSSNGSDAVQPAEP